MPHMRLAQLVESPAANDDRRCIRKRTMSSRLPRVSFYDLHNVFSVMLTRPISAPLVSVGGADCDMVTPPSAGQMKRGSDPGRRTSPRGRTEFTVYLPRARLRAAHGVSTAAGTWKRSDASACNLTARGVSASTEEPQARPQLLASQWTTGIWEDGSSPEVDRVSSAAVQRVDT